MEPAHHRIVREKLAKYLKEPLERIAGHARLRDFKRYDPSVVQELLRSAGVEIPVEELRSLERVRDLVEAVGRRASARERGAAASPGPFPSSSERLTPESGARSVLEQLVEGENAEPVHNAPPPAPAGSFESPSPYDEERIGAAAVYCSDGRVGDQVDDFLHHGLSLPRYDRVACAGGPVALAGHLMSLWESRGVEDQIRFLIRVHGLKQVVLIAHEGCAYYRERLGIPVARLEEEQRKDLETAAWAVRRMDIGLGIQAYFARRLDSVIRFEPVPLLLSLRAPAR